MPAPHTATPFETTRTSFWAMLAVALVSVAAYAYLFVTLRDINARNAELTRESETLVAEQSQAAAIRDTLAKTDASRATISSYFIDADNVVPLLETVEGYGTRAAVTTKFSNVLLQPKPRAVTVTVDAIGSFTNVYRFVSMLEAAPYELQITSAQVQTYLPPGQQEPTVPGVSDWDATVTFSVLSVNGQIASQ